MKLIVFFIFIFVLVFNNCKKEEKIIAGCNIENPIEELMWLKDIRNSLKNCTCQLSILQGRYNNKTVFYTMVTDARCNTVFHVYLWDCNGAVVKEYKFGDNETFYNEVELVKNLYICTK